MTGHFEFRFCGGMAGHGFNDNLARRSFTGREFRIDAKSFVAASFICS
jgi:hypothetical protein